MSINQDPFSLYLPISLGCLTLNVLIDENVYATNSMCLSHPHSHHLYELRFVDRGTCFQFINGQKYSAHAGDIILAHPNEYHYQTYVEDETTTAQYCIRFCVERPTGTEIPSQEKSFNRITEILTKTRCIHDESNRLSSLFSMLREEISSKPNGYIYNLQSLASLILTEFLRMSEKNVDCIFPTEDIKYRGLIITKTEFFFSRRYMHDIRIQDLASEINLSMRQAARILNQIYGMTFSQKLTEIRLERAAYDIIHTENSIRTISERCGFKSPSVFHTCFKKKYNMTPTEFKSKNIMR